MKKQTSVSAPESQIPFSLGSSALLLRAKGKNKLSRLTIQTGQDGMWELWLATRMQLLSASVNKLWTTMFSHTDPGNCYDIWVLFGHLQITTSRATRNSCRGVHPLGLHAPSCSPAPLHLTKHVCTHCIVY